MADNDWERVLEERDTFRRLYLETKEKLEQAQIHVTRLKGYQTLSGEGIGFVLNGKIVHMYGDILTYERICAYLHGPGSKALPTVTWSAWPNHGMLSPGQFVKVSVGMIVNALVTGNA